MKNLNSKLMAMCWRAMLAVALLGLQANALAATRNWNGGTDALWATSGNWDTLPVNDLTTDIAQFNAATYTFQPNAGTTSINGLIVGASSGAVTITSATSGGGLTIGGSGIDMSAAGANLTLGAGATQLFTVGAGQTWSVASGRTLSVIGKAQINNALALTGPGEFQFNVASSGTGAVTINSGTVRLMTTAATLGTGAMTINGGTIHSSSGGADWTLGNSSYAFNGNFTLDGGGGGKNHRLNTGAITLGGGVGITRIVTVSGSLALFAVAIGDGGDGNGFTKAGSAALVLLGASSYTGTTTVNGGTLNLGGTLGAGSIAGQTATGSLSTSSAIVLTSGTLQFNRTNAVTQGTDFTGGAITGAGGITQAGSAATVLTLNTANTYSGSTTVSGSSVLKLSDSLAIQNSRLNVGATAVVVFDSSVVSNSFTMGGLNGAGAITLENNAGVPAAVALSVGNNTTTSTQAGALSGAGSLIKIGSGEQVLSGTNTYSGTTTLSNGTLTLGAAGTTGSLNTASTISYSSGVTLAFNRSDTLTQGTDFNGTAIGGTVNIVQKGTSTGVTILNAANTYTGTTTVTSGKLAAGIASVPNTNGAFGFNSAVTTANTAGAVLDIAGFDTQIGSLTGGGTTGGGVTLGSNTLTVGGDNTSTTYSGVISGNGNVTKIGTGTLTLGATVSTFTGALTIKSGQITGANQNVAFGSGSIVLGDSTGSADATLTTTGNTKTHANNITVQAGSSANTLSIVGSGNLNRAFSGTVALNNNLTLSQGAGANAMSFSGVITEGGVAPLTITSTAGAVTFNSSGGFVLASGGLTLANSGASTVIVAGGATGTGDLTFNANNATGVITVSTTAINNSGTVTNSGIGAATTTISGGVGTNVFGITQNSTNSALTVSGVVTVNATATTLINTAGTQLLTLSGGTTGSGNLIINNNSSTANGITIGAAGTVNNTGKVTNSGTNSGNALISSIIGTNVTGVYQNSTTSALNLSGVNTFTNNGATTFGLNIQAGTVNALTSGSALGAGAVTLGNTTGTNAASLIIGTTGLSFGNAIVLATNANVGALTIGTSGNFSTTFTGGVTGMNNFTINSGGTQQITFNTGALDNQGTITNASTGTIGNVAGNVINAVIGGNVVGIIQNSATGNMTLGGNNTGFVGYVSVSNGSLRVGNAAALSSANTVSVTNVTGAVFDLNNFDQTIAGLNSVAGAGTGNVTNTGAGTKTLTLGGSGTYDYSGSISPAIASRIVVIKSGSGTQFLNGTSTYSGATDITGGDLRGTGTLSGSKVKFTTAGGSLWPGLANFASGVTSDQIMHVNAVDFTNGKLKIALNASNRQILDLTGAVAGSTTLGGTLSFGVPSGFTGGPYTIITAAATYTGTFSDFLVNGTPVTNGTGMTDQITLAYLPNSVTVTFNSPGVTPVKIDAFSARSEAAGVTVSWTAVSEYQNAGFNIYRRALESADWTKVNPALIAGRITNPDEMKYTYFDWASAGMYEYKLESVDLSGAREVYEKFSEVVSLDWNSEFSPSSVVSAETVASAQCSNGMENGARLAQRVGATFAALRASDANQAIAENRPTQKDFAREIGLRSNSETIAANNVAPVQPAVGVRWFSSSRIGAISSYSTAKVVYKDAGVMLLPQSSMPEGFDLNQVSIQREGRSMAALAKVSGGLLVYAPGYKDDYTDKDALFLRKSAKATVAGSPVSATGLFTSAMPVNVTSLTTVTNEYHDVYFDYSLRPYTFEPWFSGKYLTQGSAQEFVVKLQDVVGGSASLVVNLWSLTSSESVNPDHGIQVLVNGQAVGETSWDGGGKMLQVSFTVPSGALKTGDNVLTLVTPTIAGQDSQIAFLHSINVSFSRALDGSKPIEVNHSTNAESLYELYNVPVAGAWVVDARFADRASLVATESVAQADGTLRLRFIARSGGSGKYLVVPTGQENRPAQVSMRQVKPLKLNGSYLVTGPAQFASGTQPLLMKRAKEGIRGMYVDQEQLFDYYNYGRFGPEGIRNAVRSVRPTYLLLVGRTTYDYLNYGGLNIDPMCPAFLVSTSFWAQTTSDSAFGDLGRGYPEVAVGRLPVNNTVELAGAVNHIATYKGIPQSGARLHAVADKTDPLVADFGAQLDLMIKANHPEISWQENYLEKTCATSPEVSAAMKEAANGGADMILYSGHGNAAGLGTSSPRILDQASVQQWTGNTVFVQATCTANWMAKNVDDYRSIAIQALTQTQGGISASIGTSTYMNPDVATAFVNQLLKNSSKTGARWGTALLSSQQWAAKQGGNTFYNDLMTTEQLFGDPAMPVFAPPTTRGTSVTGTTSAGTF